MNGQLEALALIELLSLLLGVVHQRLERPAEATKPTL